MSNKENTASSEVIINGNYSNFHNSQAGRGEYHTFGSPQPSRNHPNHSLRLLQIKHAAINSCPPPLLLPTTFIVILASTLPSPEIIVLLVALMASIALLA